jgi:hypothetical protein
MGAKVADLMARAKAAQTRDPSADMAQMMMAMQACLADIVTRNFKGEIDAQLQAALDKLQSSLEASLKAYVALQIELLPVPEKVIERTIETVREIEREAADEEEESLPMTVQRKDGLIVSVKRGDEYYDVIRNKQGFIKEVRPRGM